jgi:formylglycine-generating enzyme required for sulfatase activity/serine/threonine protein kinase
MTAQDPLALAGTTVSEKYEIERAVGEGGFAIVYRARHTVWNRPVAIKVFKALGDLPADRRVGLVDAFIQEGRLLADLSERSAAICQARDVGTLKTRDGREMPYMVLEWLEGKTLEEVLDAEVAAKLPPRSPEEALRLLEPAAQALALAHRKGVAHRDVKPANIFVLGDPRGDFSVKLLDFGIAKVVQDAQRTAGSFAQTQGVVSSFTPAYGAPEQFSRAQGATGPWTDVFALALIFTELLVQVPPLRGDDLTQLAVASMDPRRRPTPRTFGANVPDALEATLARALAVTPSERFQTIGEFWEALRGALSLDMPRGFMGGDSLRAGAGLATPRGLSAVPASLGESVPIPLVRNAPSGASAPLPMTSTPVVQHHATLPAGSASARSNGSGAKVFVVAGVGVLVVAAIGFGVFARGRDSNASKVTPPIASTPAPVVSTAAPTPRTCPPGMTMIPGGKFFMGSDDRKDEENERPAHQVALSPYCMDTTEVTVAEYKTCSDRGECKRAPKENEWEGIDATEHKLYDPLCNVREPEEHANHPINCLDWELADSFCKAVSKRLPTEAEWEYATRGSDGRKYPWGDDPPTSGTFLNACGKECVAWGRKHPDPDNPLAAMYPSDDGFATTAPVGSFPKGASPFGLQDVVGNVWEWTADWYAPYSADMQTDPKGPATGEERVLRGGAWNGSDPAWVRPTYRFKIAPKLRSHGIGMRCAKTL